MVEIEFARTYAAPRQLVWDALDRSRSDGPNSGTVLEVDPPSRLVYADDGFPDGIGKGTATVTFTAVDERTTTLRVHIVADFDETVRAGAERGWGSQMEKLAEFLAAA